jgi:hypothetical protein
LTHLAAASTFLFVFNFEDLDLLVVGRIARRINANTKAASDTATEVVASRLPRRFITTCIVSKFNRFEIVNSPKTKAIEITAPDIIPTLIFGIITPAIILVVDAPKLLDASERVWLSIETSDALIDRYE